MKTQTYLIGLTLVITGLAITSCDRGLETGDDLSRQDKDFIRNLGVLDCWKLLAILTFRDMKNGQL